ncbi:hypothetical protein [Geosporobacter ferrireducens]|uniref:Uncharacterized protein n=1 Tax=Geosporobacter ferrireducens TaxID=1424294 RepID=A0A1D8GQX1_9FIRM|nr:hypothetical protein [Geosporobacter ferrireducens]AOT73332.1 hypothetical protein Gferi_27240 [Geosporobacter ferrireducens]
MDEELPQKLLSLEFKNAILPYSLILFSVAAALDTIYAVTLFSAAYILGMFFHMQQKLPTGFTALQKPYCSYGKSFDIFFPFYTYFTVSYFFYTVH